MATVAVPIDILGGRPDSSSTPELVYITGSNFPSDGYAFSAGGSEVLYIKIGAELYGNAGNWTLDLHWYSRSGSTTGNVQWVAALAAITPGDAQSVETKAFATSQNATITVNATAKGLTLSSIAISNLDGVNAGDTVWLKITRGTDTMVGNSIIVRASASYSDGTTGTAGSGDVVGPASATTTAFARFNGTTGKLIQNSVVLCDSSGNLTGVGNINAAAVDNILVSNGTAMTPKFYKVVASTADQTIASVTQTALTNLVFSLPAAGTYFFEFELQTATLTGATTQAFSVSYSGTVTGGIANALFTTTSATFATANTTTFSTAGTMAGTRTTITTVFLTTVRGSVTVSTSGTLQLNGASGNAADSLVVKARSAGLCVQQ